MADTHKLVDAWDVAAVAEESQKRLVAGLSDKDLDPKIDAVPLSHADAQNWFYKDPQVTEKAPRLLI